MKVEFESSVVHAMLPLMERRAEELFNQIEDLNSEYKSLISAIEQAKQAGKPRPETASGSPRIRLEKGKADSIIFNLIKALPSGQGLTTVEIVNRTGIKYATVYRTLTSNNKGSFVCVDNKWMKK